MKTEDTQDTPTSLECDLNTPGSTAYMIQEAHAMKALEDAADTTTQEPPQDTAGHTPDAAMLALESLTPGGSEYHQDIERCVKYVRDSLHTKHKCIVATIKAQRIVDERNTTLLAQRDELLAVVKELRSDLFYQIDGKHGPKAANDYPAIVRAGAAIERCRS